MKIRVGSLSPHQIHRVLPVVLLRTWVTLGAIGLVIAWVIVFMFRGQVPLTAKGKGIFLTRGTVVSFQATGSGQIAGWRVKVGDKVKKGDLLAELEQPLIEKELEQARQKLKDSQEKSGALRRLSETFGKLEHGALDRKRETLKKRIAVQEAQIKKSKEFGDRSYEQTKNLLAQQDQNLAMLRQLHGQRLEDLKAKVMRLEKLRTDRLATDDDLVQARETLVAQQLRLSDLDLQLFQLNLTKIKAEETYVASSNRITQREDSLADLVEELEDLSNREIELQRSLAEAGFTRTMEISELERLIKGFEEELKQNQKIFSAHDGRILELTAGAGKLVVRGQRLGSIDTRTDLQTLEAVAYFSLNDGNKIKPGMKIRLLPATVQQERFGSVMGKVVAVSSYPVTEEGVVNVVGNATVAMALTKDGHYIEVVAELTKDDTGYLWDQSSGPSAELSAGTVATAFVHLKERPPISFVIPILRGED